MAQKKSVSAKKKINVALQGGGSHGAYTWGVLDALLEDDRIEFDSISATSAGTMNAVALAAGFADKGTAKDARTVLGEVWKQVSNYGQIYSPVKQMPWDKFMPRGLMSEHPTFLMFEMGTRVFSPYQFNPADFNPLRRIIRDEIDFAAVKTSPVKLFISATCVETGDARVFTKDELNEDVIMASAALPFLYHAVNINGWHYWDGGFMGNPVLEPLIHDTKTKDLLLVHINPVIRMGTPKTSYDIDNRMMEISFNSSLEGELRNLVTLRKMRKDGWIKPQYEKQLPDVLFHAIRGDEELVDYSVSSKFITDWDFLCSLRDMGRKAGQKWLADYFDYLGKEDSVDFENEFL